MSEIKYEIIKKIGALSKSASGWAKEVNLISWNDREPKYDIRDWSADGEKMGKIYKALIVDATISAVASA